jgi:DNA topoisomerase-1
MRRSGWRRLGKKRFRYVNSRGAAITDDEQLERIAELAIPPAWTDVWISPNPRARLQATGVDSSGRKQYRYHDAFRAAQERAKYERLVDFGRGLPRLRRRAKQHLRLGPYEREWACAIAIGVVTKTWFRVGSERHARSARTYGVTTLRKRHVSVSGDEITFTFRAKNRKLVRRSISDAVLAQGVEALLDLPNGSRLLRFERDDELVALTSPLLNEYIAENLGPEYTAKDFRTWGGTLLAAEELARRGPADSETEAKHVLVDVMELVGEELGNTAAVARASYVSPHVVELYRAGRTLEDFRSPNGSRPSRLTASEDALLALLETPAD